MKVKAIFFDFDETLVATDKATIEAYKEVANLFRVTKPFDGLDSIKRKLSPFIETVIASFKIKLKSIPNGEYKVASAEDIRTRLWLESLFESCPADEADAIKELSELASELYKVWNTARIEHLSMLEPVTIPVLKKLRENHKLVLITNGCSSVQWEKIHSSGIEKFFDFVIVSGDEPEDKPHSSIFYKACSLCDVQPEECAMVGDTIQTDIVGANQCSLSASIYITAKGQKETLHSNEHPSHCPTHTITSIEELLGIFDRS